MWIALLALLYGVLVVVGMRWDGPHGPITDWEAACQAADKTPIERKRMGCEKGEH